MAQSSLHRPSETGSWQSVGTKTAYIEPGSLWENGYCESFNARFRDEMLNGEIFYSLSPYGERGAPTGTRFVQQSHLHDFRKIVTCFNCPLNSPSYLKI